jgi:uncharacterized membrane protein YdjX (TVP38/TMEM64 family)
MEQPDEPTRSTGRGRRSRVGLWAIMALPLVMGLAVYTAGRYVTAEQVFSFYGDVREFVRAHLPIAVLAYIAAYGSAVALSIPGSVFLTAIGGLLFGGVLGGSSALVAATAGSTLLFVVARGVALNLVPQGLRGRFDRLVEAMGRDTGWYLLMVRFAPVIPFWLVNLAAAVVAVPLRLFVATTFAGMAPATFAFAFAGAELDNIVAERHAAYRECRQASAAACGFDLTFDKLATPGMLTALGCLALLAGVPILLRRLGIMSFSSGPDLR